MPVQNHSSITAAPGVQASITVLLERALDLENLSSHDEFFQLLETYAQKRGRSHDGDHQRAAEIWDSLKQALPPSKHELLDEFEDVHLQMRTTEAETAFELGRRVAIALEHRALRRGGETALDDADVRAGEER